MSAQRAEGEKREKEGETPKEFDETTSGSKINL